MLRSSCWLIVQSSLAGLWCLWHSQGRQVGCKLSSIVVQCVWDVECKQSSLHEPLHTSDLLWGEHVTSKHTFAVQNLLDFTLCGRTCTSWTSSTGVKRICSLLWMWMQSLLSWWGCSGAKFLISNLGCDWEKHGCFITPYIKSEMKTSSPLL